MRKSSTSDGGREMNSQVIYMRKSSDDNRVMNSQVIVHERKSSTQATEIGGSQYQHSMLFAAVRSTPLY